MKKFKLLSLLGIALVSLALVGCDKNEDGDIIIEEINNDAVISYNDNLVDFASVCIESEDAVWDTYQDETASIQDIETAINNTISECNTAKDKVNSLWAWNWDNSLKDSVITIIEKDIEYYTKFKEILPFLEMDELSEEEAASYDAIINEIEAIDAELTEANSNLIIIQETFAKNNWFDLQPVDEENYEE